jgi:hypothetical protein
MTRVTTPKIGHPRVYPGHVVPVIYPGEVASAQLGITEATLRAARETQQPVSLQVTGWIVEPAPGWHAWWRRTRYRYWGRWFSTGRPQLEGTLSIRDRREGD